MTVGAFAAGSVAVAASRRRAAAAASTSGVAIVLTIAGIDYSENLLLDTLTITDELNSRNTCAFSLEDRTKTLHLTSGEVIRITYRGALIFAGTVDEVEEQVPADVCEYMIHQVRCVDWNQLADRHVIANKWPAGESFYTIVTQIVNTYSDVGGGGETMTAEGVTANTSTVELIPVMEAVVFNYDTVADAFDELAKITGYWWNIDYNKVLHFLNPANRLAPYDLDDSTWQEWRRLRVTRTRGQYRNVQYLRAGKDETSVNANVETFKGDGENQTFGLKLEVSRTPTVKVNSVGKTVGIRQKESGKDWYYQVGDKDITQDGSGTKLTSSDTLEVTYTGYFPIIQQGRNEVEITRRKAIEGGTGVYVFVETDEKVDDAGLAAAKTNGLLRRYGHIPNQVEFETDRDGFQAGQRIYVNLGDHGIEGDYLIDAVEIRMVANAFLRYTVRCVDGESVGSWANFFKALAFVNRKAFAIRENEQLLLLRQHEDQILLSDTLSTTEPLQGYLSDAYSYWIPGVSAIGGRRNSSIDVEDDAGAYYGPLVGTPASVT